MATAPRPGPPPGPQVASTSLDQVSSQDLAALDSAESWHEVSGTRVFAQLGLGNVAT